MLARGCGQSERKYKDSGIALGQNQSFDEFSKGGTPIVYNFASPLVTKILCPTDGVNGIELKQK